MTHVLLNDFAGHAFMLDLARAYDDRGAPIVYQYCDTNLSPHAEFEAAGVRVETVSTRTPFEKYRVARRVLSELEYGWHASRSLWSHRPHVAILNNWPLLALPAALIVGKLRGSTRLVWLQDIQSGLVAGVAGGGAVARIARWVESQVLRRADAVVAISDDLADMVESFGVTRERITVIENWAPVAEVPQHGRDNDWATRRGLSDRPRLLYSGTMARKHNPQLMIDLASALPEADVVVVSEGVGATWLRNELMARDLPNLRVLPFQPFAELPQVLASADVLVALLTDEAGGHSVPSKVLSYLCAGRPILASMADTNAAARMITERAGAGIATPPGDTDSFVIAAKRLIAEPDTRAEMGAAGRAFAEATFSSDRVADVVDQLAAAASRR